MSGGGPPALGVIIPAYRASATIADCLASLAVQRHPPSFEVIIVDSSPDDSTETLVRPFRREMGGRLDLQFIRRSEQTYPGTARNLGVAQTGAPRLLFLDADCLAYPDLLSRAMGALDTGATVAGGSIAMPLRPGVSGRLRHLLEFKESLPGVPARSTWQIPTACAIFERIVFEEFGGFPDQRASEDWLLNWKMWVAGQRMVFDPRMRIRHCTPRGWSSLVRYSRLLGFASGRARRLGGLPGQWAVRHPWMAAVLPFARTGRALVWTARYARKEFAFLFFSWPAYLGVACVWAWGFSDGVRAEVREKKMEAVGR